MSPPSSRPKSAVTRITTSPQDTPRRRGRPPKAAQAIGGDTPVIAREQIIERAFQLAKVEPLAEISIVGLAREFGVTSALIHYYVGSRDELISGVVNQYFKMRVERLGKMTGDWRADLEQHARHSYALMLEYGGVLRYVMSHNRFRLFQQVEPGQADYGLVYLDRVARIFRDGGFNAEHTAMGYHLIAQYCMASAYAQVSRQLPADHAAFIRKRIESVPMGEYGAAHFMVDEFTKIDADKAFEAGLGVLLDAMEGWRKGQQADSRPA